MITKILRFFQDRRNKKREERNAKSHRIWFEFDCGDCGLHWRKRKEFSCAVYRHINMEGK